MFFNRTVRCSFTWYTRTLPMYTMCLRTYSTVPVYCLLQSFFLCTDSLPRSLLFLMTYTFSFFLSISLHSFLLLILPPHIKCIYFVTFHSYYFTSFDTNRSIFQILYLPLYYRFYGWYDVHQILDGFIIVKIKGIVVMSTEASSIQFNSVIHSKIKFRWNCSFLFLFYFRTHFFCQLFSFVCTSL